MTEWGATMLLSHRHGRDPPTTPDLRAKNLKKFVPHMTYFFETDHRKINSDPW